MRMRRVTVEKQVQWILSYVQRELANVWKENIIENLERKLLNYEIVEEFGSRSDEMLKVVKLKKIEQRSKMMKEFV